MQSDDKGETGADPVFSPVRGHVGAVLNVRENTDPKKHIQGRKIYFILDIFKAAVREQS